MKNLILLSFFFLCYSKTYCQAVYKHKIQEIQFDEEYVFIPTQSEILPDSIQAMQYEVRNFGYYNDRLFIENNGIEAYRENLPSLLGRLIYKNSSSAEIGLVKFTKDSIENKTIVPKDGVVKTERISTKSETKVGLFIEFEISSDEMIEYSQEDVSRSVLAPNDINISKLGGFIERTQSTENGIKKLEDAHIIMAVTVTEIKYRKYTKDSRKLSAKDIPKISSIFSFNNYFYTTNELFERKFIIGLSIVNLKRIQEELGYN